MSDEKFGPKEAAKVEELWARVFQSSNRVLVQHLKYGFDGFQNVPRPNVHDMLITLRAFNAVFDVLQDDDMPYEQSRQLLNAKAQITNMERLALALKADNREDYDAAVEALDRQAVV